MKRRDVEDFYPLSPLQQGLLFETLEAPGSSGAYCEQVTCRLVGSLDLPAFRRAWRRVLERHPALRTTFVWRGVQEPVQVVGRRPRLPLALLDWQGLDRAATGALFSRLLRWDRRRGFDLSRGPLLRLCLVRLEPRRHLLLWSHHHLLLDGWSVGRVMGEAVALYGAAFRGREPELPRPRPFRDYVAWLRRARDPAAAERAWRRALAGFTEPTELDLAPPGAPAARAPGETELRLGGPEAGALVQLARTHGLTLNTLFQGAWALLLSRYSGRREVLFGTVVAGRPPELPGVDEMVGMFINTLPVRVPVPPGAELVEWLRGIQDRWSALQEVQHTPLVDVHGWSDVPRGRPLFETLMVFESYPAPDFPVGAEAGLEVEGLVVLEQTGYPLTAVAGSAGGEMGVRLQFDGGRLDPASARRLLGHLRTLLAALAEGPGRSVGSLPMLTRSEAHQLLQEWGRARQEPTAAGCLHPLFEAAAGRYPDAVAAVQPPEPGGRGAEGAARALTYGGLDRRSAALASRLRELGAGPDVLVGISVPRSLELVVAVLGVLRAGAAYLPLDPDYPARRLAFLVEDAGVRLAVAPGEGPPGLAGRPDLKLVPPDGGGAGDRRPRRGSTAVPEPGNLAYVIYTSGSTGRPKGTAIPHAAAVRLLAVTWEPFGLGPGDVWTLFHSYAFDFSVWELWGALAFGGRVVVVPRWVARSPESFAALLARERVTVLNQTPSAFRGLLQVWEEAAPAGRGRSLRWVIFGGEALAPATLAPWLLRGRGPAATAVNMYGITETTVHVTRRRLGPVDVEAGGSPVGRALPDLDLLLLDRDLRPVPMGVPGEIHVGGPGLARGYLGRPGLTAERFVPHPGGAQTGARLYRSGDRARHRPGGDLEFMGRADSQLKVRGHRIEPGEVEVALEAHPGVRRAVVALRQAGAAGQVLTAYVVPAEGRDEGWEPAEELRAHVAARLPDPMVPGAFVVLAELPLTVHGKLDTGALPEPGAAARGTAGRGTAGGPLEEVLAALWAEVLGVERVDRDDDFFALGGHSLVAARLVSRIRATLGREVTVRALFEAPTVAALARVVAGLESGAEGPPPTRVPRGFPLPASFAQERLWFLDRLEPGNPAYNLPFAARLRGRLEPGRLARGLRLLAVRHEALRTTLVSRDGRPVQVIAPRHRLPLPAVDLTGLGIAADAAARRLAAGEAGRGFDLARGPLVRARLLRLGPEEHLCLLSLHHAVADGWSLSILVEELGRLYTGPDDPTALPELPLGYADFAVWQRRHLEGELLERQLAFWRGALADAPQGPPLPTDRPRPALQSFRGAYRPFHLPLGLSRQVAALARRRAVTPFMTLLAGFFVLLGRSGATQDLLVGTPVAGRTRPEAEGLVGFFVNTLVLRGDLSGDPPFTELLERVRETTLAAFAHGDLPFPRLVEALGPGRDLSHQPLFQVAFALQNAPRPRLELPGLTLEPVEVERRTARFDLTLELAETAAGLAGGLEYCSDLFDATTAGRLLRHLETLLAGAVAAPQRRLSALPLLAPAEAHQVLAEWNDTAAAYPFAGGLLAPVLERAGRCPEAVAAVFEAGAETLSYGALARRAGRLAAGLAAVGAGPEARVAVALPRGLDLVVGLLATLWTGAAYLPLDPEDPPGRLAGLLADAGAAALLAAGALRRRLAPPPSFPVLAPGTWPAAGGPTPPPARPHPHSLAYVLYTSGSTGAPKAVMVAHGAIENRLRWMQETYRLGAGDRVLQKTPVTFDVSVWELFWPLAVGAPMVLARPGGHRDPGYLVRLIERQAVTTVHFVASMLRAFLEEPDLARRCASLRRIIASGEALAPDLAAACAGRLGAELHNLYGPTEAAVDVTAWRCAGGDGRGVPIGRPVANTTIHLLDRRLRPVPPGAPGELYIGGVQLARGYLGRPGFTAGRFVPDPWGGPAGGGARLYATGDLARRLPGGEVDFLGRLDHQVKIRGVRIEPGEVQAALTAHPAVGAAAVVVRELVGGDPGLVAYAVPDPETAPVVRRCLGLEAAGRLEAGSLQELPGGLAVAHLNRAETDFLYREIFAADTYFRHGVELGPGATVVDVGANIGLFCLRAAREAPGVRLLAFEPIAEICRVLRLNVELYGLDARVFEAGLAAEPGEARFTYYPHLSLLSGRWADPGEETRAVRSYLATDPQAESLTPEEEAALLADRLAAEEVRCRLTTLSRVLREEGVDAVDLLKVDAEKGELEVLAGIEPGDWPRIRQVVVEVHDRDGRLARVEGLLRDRGFEVAAERDPLLGEASLVNLYARRPGPAPASAPRPRPPRWVLPRRLVADLKEHLAGRLPEPLVPAAVVLLPALPLTANGKLDRRALPAPEQAAQAAPARGLESRDEAVLAGLWSELLGVGEVGPGDDFFALGGHSLLGARLLARIHHSFGVELPLERLFSAPTLGALAREVAAARGGAGAVPIPPARLARGELPPLSFAQERMWFLDRFEPAATAYNVPSPVVVRGPLEARRLAGSLARVIRRHAVLRTSFPEVDGEPRQRVAAAPRRPWPLPLVDLTALPGAVRRRPGEELARREARRRFDLTRGPVLRSCLVRLDRGEHLLLLTLHHIVTDAWSMPLLVGELARGYGAAGEPGSGAAAAAPLPIAYADFAVWQRRRDLDRDLAYWRRRLAGAPTSLDLPCDRPRPAAPSFVGGRVPVVLPATSVERLDTLARGAGATRFMALLAVFAALLRRLSGSGDLVVGTPAAQRNRAELEELVGLFLNTLVLRCDASGDPPFADLLARVRATCLEAYAHGELPFERLIDELHPERDTGRNPLFQVMLVTEETPPASVASGELHLEPLELPGETAKLDLMLSLEPGAGGALSGAFEYSADLFDPSTVRRLARQLEALVGRAAGRPGTRLGELPLLTPAEAHQLLREWNDTAAPGPAGHLHRSFEARARERPDSLAVVLAPEPGTRPVARTYGELAAAAAGLAGRLRRLGVGAGERAAVLLPPSPERWVAVLAALAAGAAYVGLDPADPPERLAFLLADCRARVLLARPGAPAAGAELPAACTPVHLDADALRTAACEDGPPPEPVHPDQLAYVIYTSGSTGRPKGVAMSHRALANLVAWQRRTSPPGAAARTLAFASLSFDVSCQESFSTWAAGGTLVLVPEGTRREPAALWRLLCEERVTRAFLPFAALGGLAAAAVETRDLPQALAEVAVAGEQLRIDPPVVRLFRRLPGAALRNHYGPSETHVGTWFPLTGPPEGWPALPSVGRPVANFQAMLLDSRGRPVPLGVMGELALGGAGLARGYLRRPGRTAASFVPHPAPPAAGARLYLTGDLARHLPCGDLQFLGRRDRQVKVRGHRVEPGEVEAALAACPGVVAAVVEPWEAAPGDLRLAAWVVPSGAAAPSSARLRAHLRERLPEAMVPGAFVTLESLPLTASGKVDRRRLPSPRAGAAGVAGRPPGTPLEEAVAELMAEVLGVAGVGVERSFFDLGGHSLSAVRLASRVRDVLGVELPLRRLFEHPTAAGLAAEVERLGTPERSAEDRLRPVPRGAELPLSHSQERLWFLDQLEPASGAYNLPSAVRLTGGLDLGAFVRALREIVRRHETLRTTFPSRDGRPGQVIGPRAAVPLAMTDLSRLGLQQRRGEAERLAALEAAGPFDLARGPVFRARLLRLAPEGHLFLITAHHIVSDGWSLGVLHRELAALYGAFARGRPSPLAELPVGYADYAWWQRRWMGTEAAAVQLAYWRRRLTPEPPALELPAARSRPEGGSYRGAAEHRVLGGGLAADLVALARRQGATLFMVLLAAFKAVLARYSGQQDLVVGTPTAGRGRSEVEGLIGCFLNTLALRTDLSGDPGFEELLARVREAALGAYSHQEVPFEKLLEEVQPQRDTSRTPLFQVMFTMLDFSGTGSVPRELPGLGLEPVSLPGVAAKLDLSLYAAREGDGLGLRLVYRTDLFDADQARRLLDHLGGVLGAVVEAPALRLSELPMAPPPGEREAELRRTVTPGVERAGGELPEGGLTAQIAHRVAAAPDRAAVSWEGRCWSYGHLSRQAARVAAAVAARPGSPERRVALLLPPGGPQVAAILGVLAAGAAYVPLDPVHPSRRLAAILRDSRAFLLLAGGGLEERARELAGDLPPGGEVAAFPGLPPAAARPEPAPAAAEAPAYLLYTSGSTGEPKGVVQSRGNLARHIQAYARALGLGAGDRLSCLASYAFDASLMDLFGGLLTGATLCMREVRGEGLVGLSRWLAQRAVTVLHATPSLFRHLLEEPGLEEAPVRWVVLGGEEVRPRDVAGFRRRFPPEVLLVNGLGPTESTLALQAFLAPAEPIPRHGVPVGRPVSGMAVALQTPVGEQPAAYGVGEIALRGRALAVGYQGRPGATAAAFRPDPAGQGGREYRTGDLGRWLSDGRLVFVGRIDQQVKVRGHRIEPGEVEAALVAHPGVREAVVVAWDGGTGGPRLVAYAVTAGTGAPGAEALRRHLEARLPPPMVPSELVLLDALPLTATGKVDRRALPVPRGGRPAGSEPAVPPRTPLEDEVARVWRELLGVEEVGVHDDFFELGGHSLLATQVVARLRQRFAVALPLRRLFEGPTVAGLARAVEAARVEGHRGEAEGGPGLVALPRAGRRVRRSQLAAVAGSLTCDRLPGPAPIVTAPDTAGKLHHQEDHAMDLSLFFFSADGSSAAGDKYRLLMESVRFADRNGFAAVWTPERHFNAFGGLYPNPAVTSAALAAVTERIQLRAGSVVMPLQNPVRVAEEWAVVDNLSRGRVGIAFASGWHVNDFALAPGSYERRREAMLEGIDLFRRLWRGEAVKLVNGAGREVELEVFPRPLQAEPPLWLTCQSDRTFERAGAMGLGVLTNLNYKTVDELAQRIDLYRRARAEAGLDPAAGRVTLMLHTYVADDPERLRRELKSAYGGYLLTNLGLQMRLVEGLGAEAELDDEDRRYLMDRAFERLVESHGLVGTPEDCRRKLTRFAAAGVDEIACLIDFGLGLEAVMESLHRVASLPADQGQGRRPVREGSG